MLEGRGRDVTYGIGLVSLGLLLVNSLLLGTRQQGSVEEIHRCEQPKTTITIPNQL
jgi:hypothetical protein